MDKKILVLHIKKKWFDMIASGEKTEEYREIKPYWLTRLYYAKVWFDHVLFINGYNKDSPRIEKKIESITFGRPKKGLCPDEFLDKDYFVIKFK